MPTIFLVEDHADSRLALKMILEKKGFEVITAFDMTTGISVGRRNAFDILICDIGLPDGTGIDVLKALREERFFPAIALTGYVTKENLDHYSESGFAECIAKPYNISHLIEAVKGLLSESSATK